MFCPIRTLALSASLALIGCAAHLPQAERIAPAQLLDASAMEAAQDEFFRGTSHDVLETAVQKARTAGPSTAAYHELAYELARLKGESEAAGEHLMAALMDGAAENTLDLLGQTGEVRWTVGAQKRLTSLYRGLAQEHPDPVVRADAASRLGPMTHLFGQPTPKESIRSAVGYRPALHVLGPFDNDQGKGFDIAYPPESEIDLAQTYAGKLAQLSWRRLAPKDRLGLLDFGAMMHPSRWQIAYALGAFEVREAGQYEIRIGASAATKVWLDGVELFADRKLEQYRFDSIILPAQLEAGTHRLLIKSSQGQGSWKMGVRITRADGEPAASGTLVDADPMVVPTSRAQGQARTLDEIAEARYADLAPSSRRAYLLTRYWKDLGIKTKAIETALSAMADQGESLLRMELLAVAYWNNQERGQAADLLNRLQERAGLQLARLGLHQARFWQQQKLQEKARRLLRTLKAAHPKNVEVTFALAKSYHREKWYAEEYALLKELSARVQVWPSIHFALADCLEKMRYFNEAGSLYQAVADGMPNSYTALKNLYWLALVQDRYKEAQKRAKALSEKWPLRVANWKRLAESSRRMRDYATSRKAYERLKTLSPLNPIAERKLGDIAMEDGQQDLAIGHWKRALKLNPDNQALANRIAWLEPEEAGGWVLDVPPDREIDRLVRDAQNIKPKKGANIVHLMDDEVSLLGSDGSTSNIVTSVSFAVNQKGRDDLTRLSLRSGGRQRLLKAYAVDPDGVRQEASSIRGRVVRFRQLKIGSVVVLQYRTDEPPDGYLVGHLARSWWFQMYNQEVRSSRWVLWVPDGTTIKSAKVGSFDYSESDKGQHTRMVWEAANLPPLIGEAGGPTMREVATNVAITTVPNWETFFEWEKALLVDAFREDPELKTLAEEIVQGAETPQDKILRIHAYLIKKIRYQQDYERRIAGVKPHSAPVVVARQYGDCKDKAVLFITLAKLVGLKAHFALVRTRDAGPVLKDVPMQQFNHAIVYVPAQPGIPEGQFFDPTVDALDVTVLRHDDQGTLSAVYDPETETHTWRRIPYQKASADVERFKLAGTVSNSGRLDGTLELWAQGKSGQAIRRAARNPEHLERILPRIVRNRSIPKAELKGYSKGDLTDLFTPAYLKMDMFSPDFARQEGKESRIRIPIDWNPGSLFVLDTRKLPLLFGRPRQLEWSLELELPLGAKVSYLPESASHSTGCISFERKVALAGRTVTVSQTVAFLCERVEPEDYKKHRIWEAKINTLIAQDIVFRGVKITRDPDPQVSRLY